MNDKKDRMKSTLHIFGVLLIFAGGILLLPLLALPFYLEELRYAKALLIPALTAMTLGFLLRLLRPTQVYRLSAQQSAVIVTLLWLATTFFSAFPFLLSGELNFTQACFESMSAWTTTGLSVVDVETAPRIFLLYRSIMQFFGGVGLILVVVSALSETYGMKLYSAEGHSDKLLPNLAKSARLILVIYLGYFIAGVVLYVVAGMPVFDALNHSMAALSTGGFSTKADSIGAYDSLPIELITIILMLLGTTNFFANMLLVRGRFKEFFRLGEMRFAFLLLSLAIPIVAFAALVHIYDNVGQAFRISLFNLISAMTTTGFSTVGYEKWPPLAIFVMILLILIGGAAGSTAGGIKFNRIYVMFKVFIWNIKRKFMPERSMNELFVYTTQGKTFVDNAFYTDAANYFFIYLVLISVGTGILSSQGYTLIDSLFEFASATGTVGLSIGITAPDAPPVVLWTMVVGMLLGRLEIYIVFISIVRGIKALGGAVEK